jgi:hypothetical protein
LGNAGITVGIRGTGVTVESIVPVAVASIVELAIALSVGVVTASKVAVAVKSGVALIDGITTEEGSSD